MQNRAALESVMEAVFATKPTDHWVEVLEAAGVPWGPVYNYAQMFADPQVRHRGLIQYASDPELGEVAHLRTPIKIGDGVRVAHRLPQARPATAPRSSAGWASARRGSNDCRLNEPQHGADRNR